MPENSLAYSQDAFKTWYLPVFQYQLNTANPILSVIDADSDSVQGKEIVMGLRYGRQGGLGARTESGPLPTPNARKTKQARWDTKNLFGRIQITDKAMRASRSERGAFVSLLETDIEDALTDAKDDLARQSFGDGTGKMATLTAGGPTLTLTVDTVQFLYEGMLIDILDNTNTVKAGMSGREITVVDDVNRTITLSGANVTVLGTDFIVRSGNYGLEITGMGAVFTPNNTLYNVPRATNKYFNPTVIPVGGNLSEVILQKGTDETDRKAGGKVNFYCSSHGVRRNYQSLLLATKHIVNVKQLEGGYDALVYNDKPFTVDKYAPTGTLFGLDTTTWKMYQIMDWDWVDDDGAVLSRVSGFPIWEAVLARYCDLGCKLPAGNFKMTGITES
jgi:hypothetical protein